MANDKINVDFGDSAIATELARMTTNAWRAIPTYDIGKIGYDLDFFDWTEAEKTMAIEKNIATVEEARKSKALVELGYSEAFAKWIIGQRKFDDAYAVGQQKDLSMDMKVAAILG